MPEMTCTRHLLFSARFFLVSHQVSDQSLLCCEVALHLSRTDQFRYRLYLVSPRWTHRLQCLFRWQKIMSIRTLRSRRLLNGGDAGVEAPDVPLSTVAVSDCVFLNEQSMVAHFAQPCEAFDPQLMCRLEWQGTVRCFKFACRARKAVGDSAIIPAESVPASYRICLRAACSRAFD